MKTLCFSTASGQKSAAISDVVLEAGVAWAGMKHTGTSPQMFGMAVSSGAIENIQAPLGALAGVQNQLVFLDAYANDIMALDFTGATLNPSNTSIPIIGLCWS